MDSKEFRKRYNEIVNHFETIKPKITNEMISWKNSRLISISHLEYKYTHQYDEINRLILINSPYFDASVYQATHTQMPSLSFSGCFKLPLFEGLGEGI